MSGDADGFFAGLIWQIVKVDIHRQTRSVAVEEIDRGAPLEREICLSADIGQDGQQKPGLADIALTEIRHDPRALPRRQAR
jgi:hypothetical protein